MSLFQRLILSLVSPRLAEAMEQDSRLWTMRCLTCGSEISIWEAGGVRYRAAKRSRTLYRCLKCSRIRCHEVYKKGPPLAQNSPRLQQS